jgi:hypothetical protein
MNFRGTMLMTAFGDLTKSAQGENMMNGALLLVIPPIVRVVNGAYEVEVDFPITSGLTSRTSAT